MTKPIARDPIYRRRRFEGETIELCVRWYISDRLGYRDLVAMMAERGLIVSHTTILRWVIRYVRSSRSDGIAGHDGCTPLGESMKRTSVSVASGITSIAPWTSTARQ
jgi:hypothetical protein